MICTIGDCGYTLIPAWVIWIPAGFMALLFALPPIIAGTLPASEKPKHSKIRGLCVGLVLGLLVGFFNGMSGFELFFRPSVWPIFVVLLVIGTYYVHRRSGKTQSADPSHNEHPGRDQQAISEAGGECRHRFPD